MQVLADRFIFALHRLGINMKMSLMSSSLQLQQCLGYFIFIGGFLRWEISGRTAVFWDRASWICSKHCGVFLCSLHPFF